MATTITKFNVGGVDRRTHLLRFEIDRTINSVGTWAAFLRNPGGVYNGVFDVQNRVEFAPDTHDLFYGYIDGPAVELMGKDIESDWDEYITLRGVDSAQDLLFHNDFAYDYHTAAQDLDDILDDVFNTRIDVFPSSSPIWYTPKAGTLSPGSFEFRAGSSFLTQLQELMRQTVVPYLFYVDDVSFELKTGQAIAGVAPASGVIARTSAGDTTSNIIDQVKFQERDGDKLYNYINLYTKSPQQDAYTEENAASWAVSPIGSTDGLLDNAITTLGGKSQWSIVAYNQNPVFLSIGLQLDIPVPNPLFNYNSWDLTEGEIGVWIKYDNTAGAPGTPGAGSAPLNENLWCTLTDTAGSVASYYGDSTRVECGLWGYCTIPVGRNVSTGLLAAVNEWIITAGLFTH